MKIFVSHSSADLRLVDGLVGLLKAALNLPSSEIRCTSLDGYRLPGGANVQESLRREVSDAPAFIALLSSSSIRSTYVLFEFGARWGTQKYMLPLLAPDLSLHDLQPPITAFNVLSCDSTAQLHQVVRELAAELGLPAEPPAAYQRYVESVLECAAADTTRSSLPEGLRGEAQPVEAPEIEGATNAEEIIKDHCERQWRDDFRMRVHCQKKQREALLELQNLTPADVPTDTFARIRQDCAAQWQDDFRMRLHCERKQIEAYRELQGHRV